MPNRKAMPKREYTVAELDGFIEFHSYEEMCAHPKFKRMIDSKSILPKTPVGFYHDFEDNIPCGRSGCKQPQVNGIVVECDNGDWTNIGLKCAKEQLGLAYLDLFSNYRNKRDQKAVLESLRRAVEQAHVYAERLRNLQEGPQGARWLVQVHKTYIDQRRPAVLSELRIRADRANPRLELHRPRTKIELDLYDAEHAPVLNGNDDDETVMRRYERSENRLMINEHVGTFEGLDFFAVEGRDLIFKKLTLIITALPLVEPNELTGPQRRDWTAKLRDLESDFIQAERWIKNGVTFFNSPSNLILVKRMEADDRDRATQRNRRGSAA